MAVVYQYVGILTVDVIVFFQNPGIFHSQDSFSLMFRPRLWETSSGVVAVGVFAKDMKDVKKSVMNHSIGITGSKILFFSTPVIFQTVKLIMSHLN